MSADNLVERGFLHMVHITWELRDGRSITVRSTPEIVRNVTSLAESLGALWIQHPPGSNGARRLYIKTGPVQTIRIDPDLTTN